MTSELRRQILVSVAALTMSVLTNDAISDTAADKLASPESFASIAAPEQRSVAYFVELGKVLTHPRCVNCHPAGDRPHQGDESRLHQPPVTRGVDGHGLAAMRCSICHQGANFDPGRVPGHPEWHLAPREMAWRAKRSARSAFRSRIANVTAAGRWRISSTISAATPWSAGPGRPGLAAIPHPARR